MNEQTNQQTSKTSRIMRENEDAALNFGPKITRWSGYFCIVIGILASKIISIIAGIPMMIIGIALIFLSTYLKKKMKSYKGIIAEEAEIFDYQLQKAREYKKQQNNQEE